MDKLDIILQELQKVNQRLDSMDERISQQRQELLQGMQVLLDTEVTTKFNLLAEGQEEILRRMPNEDDMDIIDGRLADLETDVAKLKKAL